MDGHNIGNTILSKEEKWRHVLRYVGSRIDPWGSP